MTEMNPPRCAKCGRAMERGLLLDRGRNRLDTNTSTWMEGAPEWRLWGVLKMKGKERHGVITFRCESCGYLESYAPAFPGSAS